MANAGIAIVAIGAGFLLLALALMGGFAFGGEPKIEGRTYCDVTGTLSGLVRDYNTPIAGVKDVINWNMNPLGVKAGSCKVYEGGIFGSVVGSNSGAVFNTGALFGDGSVEIAITAYNSADEQVGTHKFTVNTPSGTPEKTFSEQFTFKGLEQGVQYKFKVTHPWNSNNVSYEKSLIV